MPASSLDLCLVPPPPVARPARWPLAIAGVTALLLAAAGRFTGAAWVGGATVLVAFFLAHRLGGRWLGIVGATSVPILWWVCLPAGNLAAAIFLGLSGAWWLVRFFDDPAPFNGIVAGLSLGGLLLVHRAGALVGVFAAALVLSARLRPLWRVWPWVAGAALGWALAEMTAWF